MVIQVKVDVKNWKEGDTVRIVPWMRRRYAKVGNKVGTVKEVHGFSAKVEFDRGVKAECDLSHLEKCSKESTRN